MKSSSKTKSRCSKPDLDIFVNTIPSKYAIDSDFDHRQDLSRHYAGLTGITRGGEFRTITLKLPSRANKTT